MVQDALRHQNIIHCTCPMGCVTCKVTKCVTKNSTINKSQLVTDTKIYEIFLSLLYLLRIRLSKLYDLNKGRKLLLSWYMKSFSEPTLALKSPHLKKLRRSEGGAKIVGVFRVKNHDFTPKNHIFSNFRPPPPGSAPVIWTANNCHNICLIPNGVHLRFLR